MPAFEIVAADTVDAAELHAAFAAAFADYLIGPFRTPLAQWPQFLARQGIDLRLSRVSLTDAEPVAFCLVAPRPEARSWRLGTMGALPAARGSGASAALLDDFVSRAMAAGLDAVELECFVQNTRAMRLYRKHGFLEVDALYGYRRSPAPLPPATGSPRTVELEDAFRWLDACEDGDCPLPLQVTPRSLRALAVPLQAWRHGAAQLVFSQGDDTNLQVHSLVDRQSAQRDAGELLAAWLVLHSNCSAHVPQLQRHAVGGAAMEGLGFERLPLHQAWMRRSFALVDRQVTRREPT